MIDEVIVLPILVFTGENLPAARASAATFLADQQMPVTAMLAPQFYLHLAPTVPCLALCPLLALPSSLIGTIRTIGQQVYQCMQVAANAESRIAAMAPTPGHTKAGTQEEQRMPLSPAR